MERKVILSRHEFDGFIATKRRRRLDGLANNGEAFEGDYGYAAFSAEVDTVLMGMTTYRQITQELSPARGRMWEWSAKCSHTVHPRRTQTPFLRPRTRQRRYAA
ncbi:MAG: hypothetical protein ACLRRT_07595 [Ruthenibacterium lactatiformans]